MSKEARKKDEKRSINDRSKAKKEKNGKKTVAECPWSPFKAGTHKCSRKKMKPKNVMKDVAKDVKHNAIKKSGKKKNTNAPPPPQPQPLTIGEKIADDDNVKELLLSRTQPRPQPQPQPPTKEMKKKPPTKKMKDVNPHGKALVNSSRKSWRKLTQGWGKQTKAQRMAAWDETMYKGRSRVNRIMHEENLRRAQQGQRLAFLKKEFVPSPGTPAIITSKREKQEFPDSQSQSESKIPLDAANIACEVCLSKEYVIKGKNWLIICEKCKRGYHQLCHRPKIRETGPETEQWFCETCTRSLMRKRNLDEFKVNDIVWYKHRKWAYWPGKITKIDFIRRADPRPIQVAFYPSLAEKKWAFPKTLKTWAAGTRGYQLRVSNLKAEKQKDMKRAFEIADAKAKTKRRFFEL